MSPIYAWRNVETGEVVEVERTMSESDVPPSDDRWERVLFTPSIGRVEGAGGSPFKPSKA